jgi:hypothetical protein
MGDGPGAEHLALPAEYGSPSRLLTWEAVRTRLEEAPHYWLATVRPDGRPHTVPLDGLWVDDGWWFGGSPEAVKHGNLLANPQASLHLEDAGAAVIVEGRCEWAAPDAGAAERLAKASKAKYGYGPPPSAYRAGVWRLHPTRILAWTEFPGDATRFRFP